MRVAVWPADNLGCGHYRLIYPARALQAVGADVTIDFQGPTILWDRQWANEPGPDVNLVGLAAPVEADVVVMQRPGRRWWADLIPHLRDHGIRVVVDVDDRFDRIHRRNGARKALAQEHHNERWINRACQLADQVTVTTPALLKRYGHGHGTVLPNLVPEAYLSTWGLKRPDTVGWSGFVGTHPNDLQATGGAVESVLRDGWTFHVIGDADGVRRALDLRDEPSCTGRVEFADYPAAVAELEVGIVPLERSEFNDAKSCLKLLEMSALGVPAVASPTPDNLRLNRLGAGLIAESRGQWRRLLTRLTADAAYRYDVAEASREAVAGLTYEKRCDMWFEAWTAPLRTAVPA